MNKYLSLLQNSKGNYSNLEELPNPITRSSGGSKSTLSPHLSGYWYLILEPPELNFKNNLKIVKLFSGSAESFTPHSINIENGEVVGFKGIKRMTPKSLTISNNFSITMREWQNLPIFNAIKIWTSILNPYYSVGFKKNTVPSDYKGTATVILTKSGSSNDGNNIISICKDDIETVFYYEGVFPLTIPVNTFSNDITNNELKVHSIDFSFDGYPLEGELVDMDKIIEKIKSYELQVDLNKIIDVN